MQRDQQLTKDLRLLTVVMVAVIIMVVASILLPIFSRTSCGEGTKAHCMSNLKEYAIALQQYCQDNDNMLPSSILVKHSKKWNRADFVEFATIRGEAPIKEGIRPQTLYQILYSYIGNNKDLFCNKDTSDHSKPRSQVSYWYKLAIDKAWYGEGCSKPCRKESDFMYNIDQMFLYERKNFHDAVQGHASGLKNGVQINVVYLDSHVKNITLTNCSKPAESKVWTTDPTAPGEPAYFNSKYNTNPPPPHIPTTYIDPHKYIDKL